ncbi:MAG: MYXO-CTERM sorting domain-containing protein, partial [Polyangiales bacterium]
ASDLDATTDDATTVGDTSTDPPFAPAANPDSSTAQNGGCGCRMADTSSPSGFLAVLAALSLLRRRRS